MKPLTIALAFLAMALAAPAAFAGADEKPKQIHGVGCVEAGVEARCLILRDIRSGKVFNLLVKDPRPAIGEGIEFTGALHEGPTVCMQGVAVTVTIWTKRENMKCGSGHLSKP